MKPSFNHCVIAEKLKAIVSLGLANSRMKDFYDLYWLLSHRPIDADLLRNAIQNTFKQRRTALPKTQALAFTAAFFEDPQKITQWQAFLRKNALHAPGLKEVTQKIQSFVTAKLLIP